MIIFNIIISIPEGSKTDREFANVVITYGENFSQVKQLKNVREYHFSFTNKNDLDEFINYVNGRIPGLI